MVRYQRWLSTLADDRKNGTTIGMWCSTAVMVLVVLLLTSSVPPIAGWFHLRFRPALLSFLPSFVLGLTAAYLQQKGRLSLAAHGALVLAGCFLLQFFFAALIALSRPPGSFALASLLVLTLAFHGYLARASVRYPYILTCSVAAMLCAVALFHQPDTLTVFAFVFPTGILISLMTGGAGLREHKDRRERDKLRQAIHYKALSEKTEAQTKLSRQVMDLLSYNHDAGNTLSTVFLVAELLREKLIQSSQDVPGAAELVEQLSKLLAQLERLKSLVNRAHDLADEGPVLEPASLLEIVDEVTRDCQALFPGVSIGITAPSPADRLPVRVHDGANGLRRIVENIVLNACEGNGLEAAFKIQIEIAGQAENVLLRCTDDGPGFSAVQLARPISPFTTTKTNGHGLGLFSINQLVNASGGQLSVGNAPGRGAVVNVQLVRHTVD
jgi:two-component system C4-dicarboxylate transport sensor histidine kinase DctB